MHDIIAHRNAGYPALAVQTVEEERLCAALLAALPDAPIWRVAAVGGLRDLRTGATLDERAGYPQAFSRVAQTRDAVLAVCDYQHVCRNPAAYRALRDTLPAAKRAGALIVLLAPSWALPDELRHEIPVISWSLPSRDQLASALDVCLSSIGQSADEVTRRAALDAASGLTLGEAEGAIALSIAAHGRLDRAAIEAKKLEVVRQTGYLQVSPPADPASIGGLGELRRYVADEVVSSWGDPDLRVRGVLLVGVPGTGKSLAARALGAALQCPVVRLDLGAVKGSLVGESERNLRHALAVIDAVAPAVCWLDEIEKAVGGYASSARSDSGVTLGLVGALLTWMQERTSQVAIVATCNDYAALPPEMTRAGRFDERFFVDLPSPAERREIAHVHLARFGRDGECADALASASDGWTGAEIEQCVISAARRTRRQITPEALLDAAREIRPISRTRAKEIEELRQWARGALRRANTLDDTPSEATPARRVRKGASA
jgi:hypothetical protein